MVTDHYEPDQLTDSQADTENIFESLLTGAHDTPNVGESLSRPSHSM